MTKLDAVLERIRQLPQERQDMIAIDLEFILEDEERGAPLTGEQWAEVEIALANDDEEVIPHEHVTAQARQLLKP